MNDRTLDRMINIFDYTDYKKFIRHFYREKKEQKPSFSYQVFAKKAGFKSKSSVANITCSNFPLTKKRIYDVAKAMELNKRETEYFASMVKFNSAKTVSDREHYFSKMTSFLRKNDAVKMDQDQFEYYSKWYNCVIRELVTFLDFKEDYSILAKNITPRITKVQAKKAVELLLKLKMIKRQLGGTYVQVNRVITSGDEVKSLALQKFHKKNLELASDSIDKHPKDVRDISAITVGLTEEGFKKFKNEIQIFRKHLLEKVVHFEPTECVYQISFQMFPVTKVPKEWGKNETD